MLRKAAKWAFNGDNPSDSIITSSYSANSSTLGSPALDGAWRAWYSEKHALIRGAEQDKAA